MSLQIKLIMLGDTNTGKTALIQSFLPQTWASGQPIDITPPHIMQVEDQNIEVKIWDCVGAVTLMTVVRNHYRHAHAVLLVFDVTVPSSFENIPSWLTDLAESNSRPPGWTAKDTIVTLVANKTDGDWAISRSEIDTFAAKHGVPVLYTSATSGEGVEDAFQSTVKRVAYKMKELQKAGRLPIPRKDTVSLADTTTPSAKPCC